MKKLLAILLVLCMCIGLAACAKMEDFEDNLGRDYEIENLSDDDMEYFAEYMDVDVDDFDVQDAIEATNEDTGVGVVIIECGSKKLAEELADEAGAIVKLLELSYSSKYSFDVETKGAFVLIGEEDAIADALGD